MLTTGPAQDAIDTMLEEGRSFAEIEAFIAEQPISEELKSTLWLWRGRSSRALSGATSSRWRGESRSPRRSALL